MTHKLYGMQPLHHALLVVIGWSAATLVFARIEYPQPRQKPPNRRALAKDDDWKGAAKRGDLHVRHHRRAGLRSGSKN